MSTSTEPLKPINTPEFEILNLDPANPAMQYRVWRKVSDGKREKIEWAVRKVAMRELGDIRQDLSFMNQIAWMNDNAAECPDSKLAILKYIVEPIGVAARSVEAIFDDMDRKFIAEAISDFTVSSIGERIVAMISNSQKKSQSSLKNSGKQTASGKTPKKDKEPISSTAS